MVAAANPVSLVPLDAERDARGRRYSDDEREAGYVIWKAHGRSSTATADRVGCAEGTIQAWRRADGWDARCAREMEAEADAARTAVAALVTPELAKSIAVVVKIRDDEGAANRDRLQAATF